MSMPASDPAVASSTTVPLRSVDQLVARAQASAAPRRRAVAAEAEGGDVVVELDVEPVGGGSARPRRAGRSSLLRTSQPDWPGDRRRPATDAQRRRHRARRCRRRRAAAGRSRQAAASRARRASAPHHATIFTSRSGTTMTLRGAAPSSWRWTLSDASASASAAARSSPRGARQRVAQLAVDLDRERHLVVDQQRRVERRPGGVGDHPALAQRRPALPRRGAAPSARRAGSASRTASVRVADGLRFLDRAGELVELGDRLVELQASIASPTAAMVRWSLRFERLVLARRRRRCRSPAATRAGRSATRLRSRPPTIRGRARAGCRTA